MSLILFIGSFLYQIFQFQNNTYKYISVYKIMIRRQKITDAVADLAVLLFCKNFLYQFQFITTS